MLGFGLLVAVLRAADPAAGDILALPPGPDGAPSPGTFEVTLAWRPAAGKTPAKVSAAGDWNGWKEGATPLTPNPVTGRFEASLPLARGYHDYKLVVDGTWMANPDEPGRRADPFGGSNSVLAAGESATRPVLWPVERSITPTGVEYAFLATDGRPLDGTLYWKGGPPIPGRRDGERLRFAVGGTTEIGWAGVAAWDANRTTARPYVWFDGRTAENPLGRILYFAFVDRFVNGARGNDAPIPDPRVDPAANFQGGDLDGLAWALDRDYFTALGVDLLWVSPPFAGPAKAYADGLPPHRIFTDYHGYWPLDLRQLDGRFGSAAALKRLVERGRARGIGVLVDAVFKHVHAESPIYAAHPGWFVPLKLADGRENLRLYDEFPLTTWFDRFLPAFDFEQPAVRAFQVDAGAALLAKFGAAGFRLDAVKHIPPAFFRELRAKIGPAPFLIGETIADRGAIAAYIGPDRLDGQFDFPLYNAAIPALATGSRGMDSLGAAMEASLDGYPPGAVMSNLIGNHDFPRFLAFADGDVPEGNDGREIAFEKTKIAVDGTVAGQKLRLAFAWLFSIRGVPLIYYGDELAMTGAGDPDNRRMFEGLEPKGAEAKATLGTVTALAKLRKAHPALVQGTTLPLFADAERLAFLRADFSERLVVVLSRDSEGTLEIRLPEAVTGTNLVDLSSGEAFAVGKGGVKVPMKRYGWRILEVGR